MVYRSIVDKAIQESRPFQIQECVSGDAWCAKREGFEEEKVPKKGPQLSWNVYHIWFYLETAFLSHGIQLAEECAGDRSISRLKNADVQCSPEHADG